MDALQPFYGYFLGCFCWMTVLGTIVATLMLGYFGPPLWLWTLFFGAALIGWGAPIPLLAIFAFLALVFNTPLRRVFASSVVFSAMKKLGLIPKISETERTALEAGVVWIESDLFSGRPNFKKIMDQVVYPELSPKEKKLIDEKSQKICEMVDDWKLWETREFEPEAIEFLKKEKFFGMIIPEKDGGLGFSALAHSEMVSRVSTRSVALGVFIMVPNSLGPAELLLHYGTEAQKKKYLGRLAVGDEIPCFGLTEPTAGSDAGSIVSEGIVFKDDNGELSIRLSWNKRWITLAAISTLIGLAFRLRDPENLLGKGEDLGITCALVPASFKGVHIGQRHDPLGVPFYNCPTEGTDVVISVNDDVIGGVDGVGRGWTMLMDCLSAGRGISLPSQSAGGSKFITRMVSAHATNRKQFGLSVGKFEGVEEALARIVGNTYTLEACRKVTAGAIDSGLKPPVITAIAKYYCTELSRENIIHGMDIVGGAAITRGPRNVLAHTYIATPIGITVEGANILTRTLMIFGQGAMRAHPFAYQEVAAVENNDLKAFDKAFWGHIGHIVQNLCRSIVLSVTRGRFASTPGGPARRCYQKLKWCSAVFALMADIAMGSLGGSLKARGKITGRFADILGWMYLATVTLKRWEAEGSKKEDWPIIQYSMGRAFAEMQNAFVGIFRNLEVPGLTWFFRGPVSWWAGVNAFSKPISDDVSHKVAHLIQQDTEQRDRLTEGIFIHPDARDGARIIEEAFKMVKKAEGIERKIKKAIRAKKLPKKRVRFLVEEAVSASVITRDEADVLAKSVEMRLDAIQVDDFSQKEYIERKGAPGAKS